MLRIIVTTLFPDVTIVILFPFPEVTIVIVTTLFPDVTILFPEFTIVTFCSHNLIHSDFYRAFFKRLLGNPEVLYLPGLLIRNRKFMPGDGPKKWIARTIPFRLPRIGSSALKRFQF